MMKKWFYEKNQELLESPVNKTFEELLEMDDKQFCDWVAEMRREVVRLWDDFGLPPRVGFDEQEIIKQFREMESFFNDGRTFWETDLITGKKNCIRNNSIVGNAVNQWFPTMMATKINYTSDVNGGLSIYDHFKMPELLPKMITYARRHFKRDSFYHYSNPVPVRTPEDNIIEYNAKYTSIVAKNGVDWIKQFEQKRSEGIALEVDYWLAPKESDSEYTGYDDKLRNKKWLTITKKDLEELKSIIPYRCRSNVDYKDREEFRIQVYRLGQKIFPAGLKAFRISVCQYAVNFPPLTAKLLYETYIPNDGKEHITWDPSAGWGGRILGAMSVRKDLMKLHYIGTDPNTDHNTENGRTKYHEVADFYNKHCSRSIFGDDEAHTYEIYQCGSEDMSKQPGFQKYKGKIDLVFTSPPYFAKEIYSDDPEQSAKKFSTFDAWVDGFLKPTLETAVEWLKPGGIILWNIADVKFGKDILPLEDISKSILKNLGMEYIDTIKMCLAQMPGGNRVAEQEVEVINEETGEIEKKVVSQPRAKNFCKVREAHKGAKGGKSKEIWLKYEPIFVFKKCV